MSRSGLPLSGSSRLGDSETKATTRSRPRPHSWRRRAIASSDRFRSLASPGDVRAKLVSRIAAAASPAFSRYRAGSAPPPGQSPAARSGQPPPRFQRDGAVAGDGCEEPVPRHDAVTRLVVNGATRVADLAYLGDLHLCLVQDFRREPMPRSLVLSPEITRFSPNAPGFRVNPLAFMSLMSPASRRLTWRCQGPRGRPPRGRDDGAETPARPRRLGVPLRVETTHVENRSSHSFQPPASAVDRFASHLPRVDHPRAGIGGGRMGPPDSARDGHLRSDSGWPDISTIETSSAAEPLTGLPTSLVGQPTRKVGFENLKAHSFGTRRFNNNASDISYQVNLNPDEAFDTVTSREMSDQAVTAGTTPP